jgi:hypothetical protein
MGELNPLKPEEGGLSGSIVPLREAEFFGSNEAPRLLGKVHPSERLF